MVCKCNHSYVVNSKIIGPLSTCARVAVLSSSCFPKKKSYTAIIMPFIISETISEQDYEPLFVTNYQAFSDEPALLALYPGGLDPSARAQNVAGFKSRLRFGDPNLLAAKAVDEHSGQTVAFATMWVSDENPFYPAEDGNVHLPFAEPDKREWVEWVINTRKVRRATIEALQVPGAYGRMYRGCSLCMQTFDSFFLRPDLQVLATDPARQREGAGLLRRWILGE